MLSLEKRDIFSPKTSFFNKTSLINSYEEKYSVTIKDDGFRNAKNNSVIRVTAREDETKRLEIELDSSDPKSYIKID